MATYTPNLNLSKAETSDEILSTLAANNGNFDTLDGAYASIAGRIEHAEVTSNKVTTIDEDSTNTQYPGAKAVYDSQAVQDTAIDAIENILPIGTSTGDIDDAKAYKMMGVTAEGKHEQETSNGSNVFDEADFCRNNSYYYEYDNGIKILRADERAYDSQITYTVEVESNTTYYVKADNFGHNIQIMEYTSTLVWIKSNNFTENGSMTTTANTKYFKIKFLSDNHPYNVGHVIISKEDIPYEPIVSPSPDYPQEITQVSSATLKRCGKNLINSDLWEQGKFDYLFGNESSSVNIVRTKKFEVLSSTTYTFSCNANMGELAWYFYEKDGETGIQGNHYANETAKSYSITTPANAHYMRVRIGSLANPKNISVDYNQMLEQGSTATPYEPYTLQTTPIDLAGNTINAVSDDVHDNLLIDKYGNAAIERNVPKIVLDGSDDVGWQTNPAVNNDTTYFFQINSALPNARTIRAITRDYLISDYFNTYDCYSVENVEEGTCYHQNNMRLQIRILNSRLNDISSSSASVRSLKTWLSAHPIEAYYQAATPTIIPLPKLSVLPTTVEGINHVWVDTNIGRLNIEVKYVEDLQKRIQELSTALVAIGGEA